MGSTHRREKIAQTKKKKRNRGAGKPNTRVDYHQNARIQRENREDLLGAKAPSRENRVDDLKETIGRQKNGNKMKEGRCKKKPQNHVWETRETALVCPSNHY